MSRPLIESYEVDATTGGQTATSGSGTYTTFGGAAGTYGSNGQPEKPNPIDAFFTGSRWKRDDVMFVLAALNLVFVLSSLWTAYQVTKS